MTPRKALHSSESDEWYTPDSVLEIARETMGGIDLDPASCVEANERVRARSFFGVRDDGLRRDWYGRIFLNPPYGRGDRNQSNQGLWTAKLLAEYELGHIEQVVLLVNAVPDRSWFRPLWRHHVCFAYRRIRFIAPKGVLPKSPTHGNALVYIGSRSEQFVAAVGGFGRIVRPDRCVVIPRRMPMRAA